MAASVFVIAGRARPGSNECENELTLCHTSMIQQMKGRFRDKLNVEWKIEKEKENDRRESKAQVLCGEAATAHWKKQAEA